MDDESSSGYLLFSDGILNDESNHQARLNLNEANLSLWEKFKNSLSIQGYIIVEHPEFDGLSLYSPSSKEFLGAFMRCKSDLSPVKKGEKQ